MMGGGPPMGGPGPGPIQPPGIQGPMGGNLMPNQMQGVMEPESLGLPPNVDPTLFAQMMNNPLPPQEELNRLGGM